MFFHYNNYILNNLKLCITTYGRYPKFTRAVYNNRGKHFRIYDRSTYKRYCIHLDHLLLIRSLSWQISGMMMKYEDICFLLRSFKQLLFLHSLSSAKDNP